MFLLFGNVSFHVTPATHLTLSSPLPMSIRLYVYTSILYFCFSIAALQINSSVPFFYIPYICISVRHLSFSFWLTSLCIIGSRFIHLIRTDSNVFLFMAEQYCIVYMYHNFFIHSSVDGHLDYFHVLAIVNSTAMNNGIHVSLSILVSSGYMPWNGIAGSYVGFILSF